MDKDLLDKLHSIDLRLAVYNQLLQEHIRRTETNEKAIDILMAAFIEFKSHIKLLHKLIVGFATIAGLVIAALRLL